MMHRLFILAILMSVLIPAGASAAEPNVLLFTFSSEPKVGELFTAQVAVRHNEAINAISATIAYDTTALEYIGSSDADSVIRMWVQRPAAQNGVISFEGVIPGGLQPVLTDRAPITTLRFRALKEGATALRGSAPQLFAHQPQTRLLATLPTTQTVTVSGFGTLSPMPAPAITSHDIRVVGIGGEGWFLVYDIRTSDGTVGMVRIRERLLGLPMGSWRDEISPERLSDQWRFSILDVEVGDVIPRQRYSVISWPLWVLWACILLLMVSAIIYYLRRRTY
jgi:hypothetical protein